MSERHFIVPFKTVCCGKTRHPSRSVSFCEPSRSIVEVCCGAGVRPAPRTGDNLEVLMPLTFPERRGGLCDMLEALDDKLIGRCLQLSQGDEFKFVNLKQARQTFN